ncbi:MAG: hypothetical protein ACI9LF_001820, partial [Flavobacteriales bacterium]
LAETEQLLELLISIKKIGSLILSCEIKSRCLLLISYFTLK